MKYRIADVIKAVEDNHGVLTRAAMQLGCTRQTVCNYMKSSPKLRAAVAEAREKMLDHCEVKLREHIDNGSERLLQFFLETQGRKRGYSKDAGAVGEGSGPIQRVVIEVHKTGQSEGGA